MTDPAATPVTAERAEAIARAAGQFSALGEITADALLAVVASELGDREILDDFRPVGDLRSKAVAPRTLLHVISGNTPQAGLQSLIRGVLLGSRNLCKIPAAGLPEIAAFRDALPPLLADRIEIDTELRDEWLREADAVVVFGSDETIDTLRKRVRPPVKFIGHGHRVSFAVLFEAPADLDETARLAARDISLFDQQGCLSPHVVYVAGPDAEPAREFAAALARAMAAFEKECPRGPITPDEAQAIAGLRSSYRFRAANDPRVALYESEGSTAWTVVFEEEPQFAMSPLNRFVFVKPMPDPLEPHLTLVRRHLSTIAVSPFRSPWPERAAEWGASRICALGSAQDPSLFWHQDGAETLAPLVDWVDLG